MFFRLTPDGRRHQVDLVHHYAGPFATSCWIVGGGPSLTDLPLDEIAASSAPVFAVNLAGSRLLRPTFWTAYDPSARFHRSTYLDAGVQKFVPRGRAMDLVPETTFKVADCPNTLFFDMEGRDYATAIAAGQSRVLDWCDSFVLALDIAYRLGFRRLYLAGCDMHVRASQEQLAWVASHGIDTDEITTISELDAAVQKTGVDREPLNETDPARIYHFDETKSFAASVSTDRHYDRIAQALRLSRRCFAQAGLELISVTPRSRLNDCFPYRSAAAVCERLAQQCGHIDTEREAGRYSLKGPRMPAVQWPMRDVPPPVRRHESQSEAAFVAD